MRIPPQRRQFVAGVCAAALAVAAVIALVVQHSHKPQTGSASSRAVTVPAAGGARLDARVYTPKGSGPFPLVVMPGSWGAQANEYAFAATGFAALGYEVVAYAQRGFGHSTGNIDFAGEATRHDVSTVIDWADAHTSADDKAVAVVGLSYGAGIGLLAAEHDPRIRVVAAISGWADLAQALAPGGTPSEADYRVLFRPILANGQVSSQLHTLAAQLATKQPAAALATLRTMSPARSPLSGVAALNAHKTAIFLAGTYQDSIVAPSTLVGLFDKLTGPKHLELDPGDHGASALPGLYGQPSGLWAAIVRWVAHYLHNGPGTAADQPVELTDVRTGSVHGYGAFPTATSGALNLGPVAGPSASGTLGGSAPQQWTESIAAGVSTNADAGPSEINVKTYQPPTTPIANIPRAAAAVWSGTPLTSDTVVAGEPRVHVTVSSTASSASLFAYLYDVDAAGTGTLITHGAQTLTGTAGTSQTADIQLGPIAWTVPSGHHLSLVIDSTDARYLGRSVPGSRITLSSTADDPATLTVPAG